MNTNRVRPIVRLLAGVFGTLFALAGVIAIALFAATLWRVPNAHAVPWRQLLIGVLFPLGAYTPARLLLEAAWTGKNPRLDDGPSDDVSPAA
jgi:hypothetical protein